MQPLPLTFAGAVLAACLAAPGAVLAGPTAQSSTPGLKVEAVDLKRDGAGAATLTLTITNEGAKEVDLACDLRADGGEPCRQITGVYLIDGVNKQRYLVMRDTSGKCICTDTLTKVPAKGSVTVWAKFAAPPPSVTTMSAVVPLFLPLDGVAVTGP
jgi:hypothetical protein